MSRKLILEKFKEDVIDGLNDDLVRVSFEEDEKLIESIKRAGGFYDIVTLTGGGDNGRVPWEDLFKSLVAAIAEAEGSCNKRGES